MSSGMFSSILAGDMLTDEQKQELEAADVIIEERRARWRSAREDLLTHSNRCSALQGSMQLSHLAITRQLEAHGALHEMTRQK